MGRGRVDLRTVQHMEDLTVENHPPSGPSSYISHVWNCFSALNLKKNIVLFSKSVMKSPWWYNG
jgi:hypothetical protein